MNNTIRVRTEELLNSFCLNENTINFKRAITIDVAYCVANITKQSIFDSIKHIVFPLQSNGFSHYLANYRIVFTCWVNRPDYDELLELVSKGVDSSVIIRLNNVFKRKLFRPTKLYFRALVEGIRMNLSLAQRLYVASKLIDYVMAFSTFEHDINGKPLIISKYIPLNSSYGLENVLTQYFNKINCETYHLCHGLHFSPNYRFFSVDAYNKELVEAKIVLSWGQGFVDNAKELGYTHIIVGNPKYPDKPIKINFHADSCIVFLARGQYDKNNVRLLEVLGNYKNTHDIIITIKPHPTDNIEMLNRICSKYGFLMCLNQTIKELLENNIYGFAISYETTAYFEAMYYGLVCLRYSYEENESYGEFDNRFLTCQDLDEQVIKFSSSDFGALSQKVKQSLQYEIGMGLNKYKEILS